MEKTTRFSGADWADKKEVIIVIGQGGIGSWLSLNLGRIGHTLYIVDDDTVDETNVTGGQMFMRRHISLRKTNAVKEVCREFGCDNNISTLNVKYSPSIGTTNIMMAGLDNMEGRRVAFEAWEKESRGKENALFIDGRLTIEMWEIFAIKGNDEKAIKEYKEKHLFTDEESVLLDCSTKQSTFSAMSIAASMTSTLCNFLTNVKIGGDIRTVPFYQRMYFPMNLYTLVENIEQEKEQAEVTTAIENVKTETINGE